MSSKSPRLLIVATTATTLRAFLLPFAYRMRERGWRVDALANGATTCGEIGVAFDHAFDAPWTRRLTDVRALFRAPRVLRDIVDAGQYDVVHVHTPIAAFMTRFALRHRTRDVRVVYTAHGFHAHPRGGFWRNTIFRLAERIASRWTDYLVVMNAHDETLARRDALVEPSRLMRHPGIGIDRQHFRRVTLGERSQTRSALGLTDAERVIAVVGEFNGNKRQRDVVDALAHLVASGAAAIPTVLFAGAGALQPTVEAHAHARGVQQHVRFLGQRPDVAQLVGACDALVLPSGREGFPRCLLEAMACGVPAIASDIRGSRDLLGEGRGLLYPCGDTVALARAIDATLSDPTETVRRVEKSLAWCASDADLEAVLRRHETLYAKIAGETHLAA